MIEYKIDQWFVRVEPDKRVRFWLFSNTQYTQEEQDKKICQKIIEAIGRHIDDVSQVLLDNDGYYECSFCGSTAAADKKDYECCEESITEYDNLKAKARELTEPEPLEEIK